MHAHVNMDSEDVEDREAKARRAGEIIHGSLTASTTPTYGSYQYGAIDSVHSSSSYISMQNQKACCGIMSPVRRTFCLLVLFDFILTFIIWVIYTQLRNIPLWTAFQQEVVHYSFETSLFDTVMLAAWRFVPLLLAYALFRIHNPYIVALTTFGTCVFLVCKVFLFKFSGPNNNNNIVCYLLLLVSFIIAWVETWFLDFKVLPRERKDLERQRLLDSGQFNGGGIQPGQQGQYSRTHNDEYYSPVDSNLVSDDEDHEGFRSMPRSHQHSRQHSITSTTYSLGDEEGNYLRTAEESWEKAWTFFNSDGWTKESGNDLYEGMVYSQTFPNEGKLFKLEGYIEAMPAACFEQVVFKIDQMSSWNPTVGESRVLRVINSNTDIAYTVATEAAGGLVSSRDFVNLRHWKSRKGTLFSSGCAIEYAECPPCKQHVRGANNAGGWGCKEVPGKPNMCHFVWICNTDLKGWVPKYAVDQSLTSVLKDFLKYFKIRMKELDSYDE